MGGVRNPQKKPVFLRKPIDKKEDHWGGGKKTPRGEKKTRKMPKNPQGGKKAGKLKTWRKNRKKTQGGGNPEEG